ncbi:hypothetical protein AB3S75_047754 [Citrus x aurantiifolia]
MQSITYTRGRQPPASTPPSPSPSLLRSRSGTPASECRTYNNSLTNSKQNLNTSRSKSTTRSRIHNNEENVNPSTIINACMQKKNIKDNKDGFGRLLQRGSPSNNYISDHAAAKSTKVKSVTSSPSAWALSPGRSSPCMVRPESSPENGARRVKSRGIGSGVTGFLNYFRQKKVPPAQEEEYNRFRVLHNRLLQYRLANARAEAAAASLKTAAEGKIFGVWLRVLKMRNLILEKKIEVQKFQHEIKLCQIVNPQIRLLNDWAKLEGKNIEAVGRVTRKLSALCVKIPCDDDVQADVKSIYEAMSTASQVMNGIEATITKFLLSQGERILYMLTELVSTVMLQEECLEELDTIVASVSPLTEREKYLRAHLIQAAEESIRS